MCADFSSSWGQEVLLDGQENYSLLAYLPWSSFVQDRADGSGAEAEQCAVKESVFFLLLLKDIAGLITSAGSKWDVCEVRRGMSWSKQGELVCSGFHTLFQILSSEKFSCHRSLGARSTSYFFLSSSPCALYSLFCADYPPGELARVYEPDWALLGMGLCVSLDVSAAERLLAGTAQVSDTV